MAKWYFDLCVGDNLGQWGEVLNAGPYLIAPLFADGFELGNTSAWSETAP